MASQELIPTTTKETTKKYFWKLVGYAALAVGALVVINHLAAKL